MTIFEKLDKINLDDSKNNTRNLAMSINTSEMRKVRTGGLITMGVDEQALADAMSGEGMVILLVVNRKEYKKYEK